MTYYSIEFVFGYIQISASYPIHSFYLEYCVFILILIAITVGEFDV